MKILISLPDELIAHLNSLADMRGRSNLIERLLLQALGRAESERVARLAIAGDASALAGLTPAADEYLKTSKAVHRGGESAPPKPAMDIPFGPVKRAMPKKVKP